MISSRYKNLKNNGQPSFLFPLAFTAIIIFFWSCGSESNDAINDLTDLGGTGAVGGSTSLTDSSQGQSGTSEQGGAAGQDTAVQGGAAGQDTAVQDGAAGQDTAVQGGAAGQDTAVQGGAAGQDIPAQGGTTSVDGSVIHPDGGGGPLCGNGVIDDGEECDGANLNNASCESLVGGGGSLTCNASCHYDVSMCLQDSDSSIGGYGGSGGAGGSGGTTTTTTTVQKIIPARCNGDSSGVAMVGDSYWALTGDIYSSLRQLSGQQFRPYYVSATLMASGSALLPSIPDQARRAYNAAPVETLLMNGGGNDCIMNTSCLAGGINNGTCMRSIDHALDVAGEMLREAPQNGVKEIIFFYYPHVPGFGGITNPINDYAIPIAREHCETLVGADCTFIDTIAAFDEAGARGEVLFQMDLFHPSRRGSEIIAELMWEAMEENCRNGLDLN